MNSLGLAMKVILMRIMNEEQIDGSHSFVDALRLKTEKS